MPTKSGIIGLLAAAQGRRRGDPILDLVDLRLGVRADQPGTLLRDYHTVSDYRGVPLPSSAVDARSRQKKTSPKKFTAVTQRFYLQDAIFLAIVEGDRTLVAGLREAVNHPEFPLALGRRSCVPAHPLVVRPVDPAPDDLWEGDVGTVLATAPWQASNAHRRSVKDRSGAIDHIRLAAVCDKEDGADVLTDVPLTFAHRDRSFTVRRVEHTWVSVPTDFEQDDATAAGHDRHDPFALLGW